MDTSRRAGFAGMESVSTPAVISTQDFSKMARGVVMAQWSINN